MFNCVDCNNEFSSAEETLTADGPVCFDCLDNYAFCDSCDNYRDSDWFTRCRTDSSISVDYFCNSCIAACTTIEKCMDCGIHCKDFVRVEDHSPEWIYVCTYCLERGSSEVFWCSYCAEYYAIEFYAGDGYNSLCDSCSDPELGGTFGGVEVHDYTCYCDRCSVVCRGVRKFKKGAVYYGCEIEIDLVDGNSTGAFKLIKYLDDNKILYTIKTDCSLSDGVELILQPLPASTLWRHRFKLQSLIEATKYDSGAGGAGLHINIYTKDSEAFTRLLYKRVNKKHSRYYAETVGSVRDSYNKFRLIHIKNKNLVEFRVWNGVSNEQTISAALSDLRKWLKVKGVKELATI